MPTPSEAMTEARRPLRGYVLRKLIELQAGSHPHKLIPLTEIVTPEFSTSDLRSALRGLYRVGLIKAGGGGYRVTQQGQHICRVLHRPF
jgi:hypothetical protein